MSTNLSSKNCSIIIVVSVFNKRVVDNLLSGALRAFSYYGGDDSKVLVFKVPGAFEIPGAISQVQKYHNPDAIIGIGAVIKGETPHFDLISRSTFDAIIRISVDYNKPITNGIITCLNMRQAIQRSSISQNSKKNNKGKEAADALVALLKNEPKNS